MKKAVLCGVISLLFGFASLHAKGECKQELSDFCQGVTKGDKVTLATCISWKEDDAAAEFSEACKMKLAKEREKNAKLMKTCEADREKFCAEEKPGKGLAMRCLKQHVKELSETCKTAIDRTPVKMQ